MSVPRRLAGVCLAAVLLADVGCYTYQPLVGVTPQPGERVSLELNDQGRASLGEQLGAGVLVVEGMLQEMQNDQYVVGVSSVTTIGGGSANWGGERVRIPLTAVSRSGVRTLSRGRTGVLVGLVVVGIGAFAATRSLVGGGLTAATDTMRPAPAGTSIIPR